MPTTKVTFNGLLVFWHNPHNDLYQVGALRARDAHEPHIFRILVRPDNDIDTSKIEADEIEALIQAGFVKWSLDVEISGNPIRGITSNPKTPADRHNPCGGNRHDFGWLLNVEEEFNGKDLPRNPNQLQPVIDLTFGDMFSTCKTDLADKVQHGHAGIEFGFLSGGTTLQFNTAQGAELVLNAFRRSEKREILRLTNTAQTSYDVTILNTPLAPAQMRHFHLFYDRLFAGLSANDTFDIPLHAPLSKPKCDRCPSTDTDPDPFRCGGIRVNDSSGPLI